MKARKIYITYLKKLLKPVLEHSQPFLYFFTQDLVVGGFQQHTRQCRSQDAAEAGLMGDVEAFSNSLNSLRRLPHSVRKREEVVLGPELGWGKEQALGFCSVRG